MQVSDKAGHGLPCIFAFIPQANPMLLFGYHRIVNHDGFVNVYGVVYQPVLRF